MSVRVAHKSKAFLSAFRWLPPGAAAAAQGYGGVTSARNGDTSCVRHLKIIRTAGSALDSLPTLLALTLSEEGAEPNPCLLIPLKRVL